MVQLDTDTLLTLFDFLCLFLFIGEVRQLSKKAASGK